MRAKLAAILIWPFPVMAQDVADIAGTTIRLQPGEQSEYEVEFYNRPVNGPIHNGRREVVLDGLSVLFDFTWNYAGGGADRITVYPPDGWVCVPASCELSVHESNTGAILLHRAGVGM